MSDSTSVVSAPLDIKLVKEGTTEKPPHKGSPRTKLIVIGIAVLLIVLSAVLGVWLGHKIGLRQGMQLRSRNQPSTQKTPFAGEDSTVCVLNETGLLTATFNLTLKRVPGHFPIVINTSTVGPIIVTAPLGTMTWQDYEIVVLKTWNVSRCSLRNNDYPINRSEILNFSPGGRIFPLDLKYKDSPYDGRLASIRVEKPDAKTMMELGWTDRSDRKDWKVGHVTSRVDFPPAIATFDPAARLMGRTLAITDRYRLPNGTNAFHVFACCVIARV